MICRVLALAVLFVSCANAHDARPIYVQVLETEAQVFNVSWKVPGTVRRDALPRPALPGDCKVEQAPVWFSAGAEFVGQQRFSCSAALAGREIAIVYPRANPSLSVLIKVRLADGAEHVGTLRPGELVWTVPAVERRFAVAGEYTRLGIAHIWLGVDHLLFVACLLFIARTPRRLLITITGFTVAHSITLVMSTLGWVRIATPPVEAVIALSVVFLAWEIARGRRDSLTFRFPVAVSVAFGLLHGFGFAAVLRAIGLPQTELPTALLFFNVGVEAGQLLFVAAVLALAAILRLLASKAGNMGKIDNRWISLPAAYAIGGIASYWLIERVTGFWI